MTTTQARTTVFVVGVVYLVVAIAGFVRTGFHDFGLEAPTRVFGVIGVSTVSSLFHLLAGVFALLAVLRARTDGYAMIGVLAFTVAAVFGVVARVFPGAGDPGNLTWWNVGLYLVSALTCAFVYQRALARFSGR